VKRGFDEDSEGVEHAGAPPFHFHCRAVGKLSGGSRHRRETKRRGALFRLALQVCYQSLEVRRRSQRIERVHGAEDIWLRDFLPIQIADGSFVKFRYEPDYLQGYEQMRTDERICRSIPHVPN
jgi:hypothetical protein